MPGSAPVRVPTRIRFGSGSGLRTSGGHVEGIAPPGAGESGRLSQPGVEGRVVAVGQSAAGIMMASQNSGAASLTQMSVNVQANVNAGP